VLSREKDSRAPKSTMARIKLTEKSLETYKNTEKLKPDLIRVLWIYALPNSMNWMILRRGVTWKATNY
jgi:hypothetical protein